MIRHDRLMEACVKLNDAALIGDGWSDALDALAKAAGSRGVMIMHNRDRKLMSFVSNREIAGPVEDYLAGKAPRTHARTSGMISIQAFASTTTISPPTRSRAIHTTRTGFGLSAWDGTPTQD